MIHSMNLTWRAVIQASRCEARLTRARANGLFHSNARSISKIAQKKVCVQICEKSLSPLLFHYHSIELSRSSSNVHLRESDV